MSEPEITTEYRELLAEIHALRSDVNTLMLSVGALRLLSGDIDLATPEGRKVIVQALNNFGLIIKIAREELEARTAKTEQATASPHVM